MLVGILSLTLKPQTYAARRGLYSAILDEGLAAYAPTMFINSAQSCG
jgi:hypothetical protein